MYIIYIVYTRIIRLYTVRVYTTHHLLTRQFMAPGNWINYLVRTRTRVGDVFIGSLGYARARVRVCVRVSMPRGVWGEKRPTRHMFFLRISFFLWHTLFISRRHTSPSRLFLLVFTSTNVIFPHDTHIPTTLDIRRRIKPHNIIYTSHSNIWLPGFFFNERPNHTLHYIERTRNIYSCVCVCVWSTYVRFIIPTYQRWVQQQQKCLVKIFFFYYYYYYSHGLFLFCLRRGVLYHLRKGRNFASGAHRILNHTKKWKKKKKIVT